MTLFSVKNGTKQRWEKWEEYVCGIIINFVATAYLEYAQDYRGIVQEYKL